MKPFVKSWIILFLFTLPIASTAEISSSDSNESTCYGTSAKGKIHHSWQLPLYGENFQSYSLINWPFRTYVHSTVYKILIDAYSSLESITPNIEYKYAETGLPSGGKFWPHRTHQNGRSVDLIVPVINKKTNKPDVLPSWIFNKFGYGIEFDSQGENETYVIDYSTLAKMILAIYKASLKYQAPIAKIIFAPELRIHLLQTDAGRMLKKEKIEFSKNPAWVRHDDHIHIEFLINCLPLKNN